MSRTAVLGSNALATVVQFYAAALDEATRRADQAEALLKQAMQRQPSGDPSIDEEFIQQVIYIVDHSEEKPVDNLALIGNAIRYRDARRRASSGSPTIDRNLVTADDAPRGGEVREADVPR